MRIIKSEQFGNIHVAVDECQGWVAVRDVARALGARDSYCIERKVNKDYLKNVKVSECHMDKDGGATFKDFTVKAISITGIEIVLATSKAESAADFSEFIAATVKPYVNRILKDLEIEDARAYELRISTYANVKLDKAHALKPLEEAAEAFGAWQTYIKHLDRYRERDARGELISECCDTIQAACNLLAAISCTRDELDRAIDEMNEHNIKRGRFNR